MASPSAVFSGNVSSPGQSQRFQAGRTADFWKQTFNSWGTSVACPTVQLSYGNHGWTDSGTGSEALHEFKKNNPKVRVRPHGRDGKTGPWAFGASFKSIFGNDADLKPVVPTMHYRSGSDDDANATLSVESRDVSLWEVLAFPNEVSDATLDGVPVGVFAAHVAAAYLNAVNNPNYPVKPAQVKAMWRDARTPTGYCPQGSCVNGGWRASSIVAYLQTTLWG